MSEKAKEDRISKYLVEKNKEMLFDELSHEYLEHAGVDDILGGIPIPLTFDEEGMSTLTIAVGMARIIGGDSNFKYAPQYLEYINRTLGEVAPKVLVSEAAKEGSLCEYLNACTLCRAALMLDQQSCDALYLYARACKDAYECCDEEDEAYVGSFKAESLESFELLTMLHPDFAMGYYFLGYSYLNLGLYLKAQLTWQEFMELTEGMLNSEGSTSDRPEDKAVNYGKLREEISERLEALEEPIVIENAVNKVLSGDYLGGKELLAKYTTGRYSDWWPLWYYLGIADASLGKAEEAATDFKTALKYSPSNIEVMEELCNLYEKIGDMSNYEKYLKKIEIVKSNIEAESIDF